MEDSLQQQSKSKLDLTRHSGLVNVDNLSKMRVTLIGAGAIGSMTCLFLSKMGIQHWQVFDEDGISETNIANQMYPIKSIGQFKIDILTDIVNDFSGVIILGTTRFYTKERLGNIVIVATDSMRSRKLVWKQFLKQKQCTHLIEARMGGLHGEVYCITKKDKKFYEERLYDDKDVPEVKCTEKSIIYNVAGIVSMIGAAIASIANNEDFPKEQIFDMKNMYYMTRRV